MNPEIQSLIDSLRCGQHEDPTERIGLLAAALREHNADAQTLLALLRAPQIPLRLAALEASRGATHVELIQECARLATDTDTRVRLKVAEVMGAFPENLVIKALTSLASDSDSDVQVAAIKSTAGKPSFLDLQRKILSTDSYYQVRLTACSALASQESPAVAKDLVVALANDSDDDVQKQCANSLEKRFTQSEADTLKHLPTEIGVLVKAHRNLKLLDGERFPKFFKWITDRTSDQVNPEDLARFGSDLTSLALAGTLPRAYGVEHLCETLGLMIRREPRRSIVLLGEPGTGKSALINELAYYLARPENGSWHILRVSPTDFMAGTLYIGEWETKVRNLIEAIRKPRRVVLYVPNVNDLSAAGRSSKSDANIASALAPYLEEGAVIVLGESTPSEFERSLGTLPSMKRLFDAVLLKESSGDETREILKAIRDEARSDMPDHLLEQLLDLATQYLGHIQRPGNAATLLRTVIDAQRKTSAPISLRTVLDTLSKSTGVPVDLLDDSIPFQPDSVRAFFEQRIIGQPEAVEAMIDLVTLIKAGLTDPSKPFGVFLFVGPTGVGKTELSRALAEFIFGDPTRLLRFDMSEYSAPAAFERLIGSKNENGLLTDAVRQQPFSVVLLDEIEKSHINVFDLCLQIFDAGRLTDGRGRTISFRRTIVILTSNIGAQAPTAAVGFNPAAGTADLNADKERTFRELSRFFRPEFLNRIDRVINFRPLSLEVAERIARREIDLVLRRHGISRRQLTVDVEPAVISFLVKEGYSPHFGARPLKRTVERLCLLPIARAISSGRISPRAVLVVSLRDGKVEVRVSQPSVQKPPAKQVSRGEFFLDRTEELQNRFAEIDTGDLAKRKSELLARTQSPGFYRDQAAREATFDEIHKLEQFFDWGKRLATALERLHQRSQRKTLTTVERDHLREQLDELAVELEHFRFIATCRDAVDLGDALVVLRLVERSGSPQNAVEKLAKMYAGFASRRRLTIEVLGELYDDKSDRAYLQITGLGACAVLRREDGLHQIDHRYRSRVARSGREKEREDREAIRVEVYQSMATANSMPASGAKVQPLKPPRSRLLRADYSVSWFHEPSLRSVEFWTSGPKDAAIEKAQRILGAQIGVENSQSPETRSVIRQYDLGLGSKVKDLRTGKTTTRVDLILKGRLDMLMLEDASR